MKPPEKGQVDYFDLAGPGGFGVRVSQGGTKSFFCMYRDDHGKMVRWGLGRFPAVSLAEARAAAKKRDALHEDPAGRKAELKRAGTFKQLTEQFLEDQKRHLKPKTFTEWKRIIDTELVPSFGAINPHEITRGDIKAVLKTKANDGKLHMANRILEVIRRIYSWGVEEDKVTASPCVGIKKPGGKEKPRERVLSTDEIKSVFTAIDSERPLIGAVFKLLFLTAARKGEILGMRWSDLDFDQNLVTFPDTKMNRSHTLPLSYEAIRILEMIRPLTGNMEFVFEGPRGANIQHTQKACERLRKASGIHFRTHDLRRTTATHLRRIGVKTDVISAILDHVISGPASTRIYERHDRLDEMRVALDKWARELDRIVTGKEATVVPFPG